VTDASGNIVNEQRYMPYGQPRLANSGSLTDRLFTGQRNIASLGLMDYKARFYSPTLGRFIQPDTIVPDQTSPQAFNRYSYVTNRPMSYNDPTGHDLKDRIKQYKNDYGRSWKEHAKLWNRYGVLEWGVSDEDLMEIQRLAKMGDILAYNLMGYSQFAIFALDTRTGFFGLWDMSLRRQISIRDIQSLIMGFYRFDKSAGNFKLHAGIGNSAGAREVLGETLEFSDFPVGWGLGNDAHVTISQNSEYSCNLWCMTADTISGGTLLYELGTYASGSGGNPYLLGLGGLALTVSVVLPLSPGDLVVKIHSGPAKPVPPVEIITFPTLPTK
jgi:RHS repeat-associated protein